MRRFEGVLAGIGGCPFAPDAPGNLDVERLAQHVRERGFETGTDPERLAGARAVLQAAPARAQPIERAPHAVSA